MELLHVSEEQKNRIQQEEQKILNEVDRICLKHGIRYVVAYGTLLGAIRHKGFIPWDDDVDICMPREDFNRFRNICKEELGEAFFYQDNSTDPEYFYLIDKIRLNGTVFRESYVAQYNIHHGIYIDIFPVDAIPDNWLLRNIQYYRFHFYRTGLMAKYLDLSARSGKKKAMMAVLRAVYFPFSLKYLYRKAIRTASGYRGKEHKRSGCFFSPYRKKDFFDNSMFQDTERHPFEQMGVNVPKQYDSYLRQIYGDYMELPPKEERITRHSVTELMLGNDMNKG